MLDRLVSAVHPAIDKTSHERIAMRLNHAGGATWQVSGRQIVVGVENGPNTWAHDLQTLTIGGLIGALETDGFTISYTNQDVINLSASILLDGAGRQSESNGNAIHAYDSLLWSIFDVYSADLEDASDQIVQAMREMVIPTANGEFLDYWGEHFGIDRPTSASDTSYRQIIIDEVIRLRNNGIAIENAVFDWTGNRISIYEPWRDMFILGESKLDDSSRFQDGNFYTYNVIQPVSREPIDWSSVLPIIERNRPAGTLLAETATKFMHPIQHHGICSVKYLATQSAGWFAEVQRFNMLDAMMLSGGNEDFLVDEGYTYVQESYTQSSAANIFGGWAGGWLTHGQWEDAVSTKAVGWAIRYGQIGLLASRTAQSQGYMATSVATYTNKSTLVEYWDGTWDSRRWRGGIYVLSVMQSVPG